jgi:NADH-quinone oxidoreductase subunit K
MPDLSTLFGDVGYGHFLVLGAILFAIGVGGVLLRRNVLIMMMSIEIMLNAANLTILTFARKHGDLGGHSFAMVVMAVAAAEVAVGLAIVVAIFRGRRHIDVDRMNILKH